MNAPSFLCAWAAALRFGQGYETSVLSSVLRSVTRSGKKYWPYTCNRNQVNQLERAHCKISNLRMFWPSEELPPRYKLLLGDDMAKPRKPTSKEKTIASRMMKLVTERKKCSLSTCSPLKCKITEGPKCEITCNIKKTSLLF